MQSKMSTYFLVFDLSQGNQNCDIDMLRLNDIKKAWFAGL